MESTWLQMKIQFNLLVNGTKTSVKDLMSEINFPSPDDKKEFKRARDNAYSFLNTIATRGFARKTTEKVDPTRKNSAYYFIKLKDIPESIIKRKRHEAKEIIKNIDDKKEPIIKQEKEYNPIVVFESIMAYINKLKETIETLKQTIKNERIDFKNLLEEKTHVERLYRKAQDRISELNNKLGYNGKTLKLNDIKDITKIDEGE